jgi:predicted transposase YdaD
VRQETEQRIKQEIALKLLAQGLPLGIIAQTTEFSIEELQRFQSN